MRPTLLSVLPGTSEPHSDESRPYRPSNDPLHLRSGCQAIWDGRGRGHGCAADPARRPTTTECFRATLSHRLLKAAGAAEGSLPSPNPVPPFPLSLLSYDCTVSFTAVKGSVAMCSELHCTAQCLMVDSTRSAHGWREIGLHPVPRDASVQEISMFSRTHVTQGTQPKATWT